MSILKNHGTTCNDSTTSNDICIYNHNQYSDLICHTLFDLTCHNQYSESDFICHTLFDYIRWFFFFLLHKRLLVICTFGGRISDDVSNDLVRVDINKSRIGHFCFENMDQRLQVAIEETSRNVKLLNAPIVLIILCRSAHC